MKIYTLELVIETQEISRQLFGVFTSKSKAEENIGPRDFAIVTELETDVPYGAIGGQPHWHYEPREPEEEREPEE